MNINYEKSQKLIIRADTTTNGRYANQFIRAMAAHFISQNLAANPLYPPINLARLGIQLYQPSTTNNNSLQCSGAQIINLEETNFLEYAIRPVDDPELNLEQETVADTNNNTNTNNNNCDRPTRIMDLNNIYCQTPEHALKIKDFIWGQDVCQMIKEANPHKARYGQNNDVFIHVRLGDVPFHNPGFAYYNRVLSGLEFTTGYITSDTINHPICLALIRKYRLQIINPHAAIEDILQLGSTCQHIILSAGTFSWLIGMLGFHSKVYYPDPEQKRRWHGNIFECMPTWTKISY